MLPSDDRARAGVIGVTLVVVSAVAYGTVPIIAKMAFRDGTPLPVFLSWRFSIAALVLWAAVPLSGGGLPDRRRIGGLLLMGAAGYAGQSAAFFAALQRMPAAPTALLLYTYPTIVTLGAAALFRDRLDARKIAAIVIAFAGTALVVQGSTGGLSPAGVAFALLSALMYSGYVLFGSRLFTGGAPVAAAAIVMSATAASFIAGAAVTNGLAVPGDRAQLGLIVLVAVLGTAVPVLAFLTGMPRVGPSRASILSTFEPAVTVLLAGVVLAEPLRMAQIAGAVCILASAVVLESGRPPEPARI